jgi:glycosyltransferase involved in cell wall biosynthesis
MTKQGLIYLVPWNDDPAKSLAAVQAVYPGHKIVVVEKKALRRNGFMGQLRALRQLRGKAVVFYFLSLDNLNAPLLLAWIGFLHRCASTVLLDEAGNKTVYGRWSCLRLAPIIALAIFVDVVTLLCSWVFLKSGLWRRSKSISAQVATPDVDIAYLFPYPMSRFDVGGAISHVRGFLCGLKEDGVNCHIFTGRPLADEYFPEKCIPLSRRPFFFWEARALAYNWRFARAVSASLKKEPPKAFYQRHGRFVVAGALLSRMVRVPLILEYNGSEVWVAQNWDPVHFRIWLRLCEQYSLAAASLIVVVSEPLRQELIERGIPEEKILTNPNAVDPGMFQPGRGGNEVRRELGLAPDDLVACFVGTFSYWHGMPVLQEAVGRLLQMAEQDASLRRLHFLMVGDGPLRAEVATHLETWVRHGLVIFAGTVPHEHIPACLDAADILLSPHVPFADGSEFFGSPTKLFEYMAMGKAIIASNLGQIGVVLSHNETGWLVAPGCVDELVAAVLHLAGHPEIRTRLGKQAREAVLARHTWQRNAQTVLTALGICAKSKDSILLSARHEASRTAAKLSTETDG